MGVNDAVLQSVLARISQMEASGQEVPDYLRQQARLMQAAAEVAQKFATPEVRPALRPDNPAAQGLPTSQIGNAVPGLPQGSPDQTMLGGYKRAGKLVASNLLEGGVGGGMDLIGMGAKSVLSGGNPLIAATPQANDLADKLTPDWWNELRAKVRAPSDESLAENPTMPAAVASMAAQFAAPGLPLERLGVVGKLASHTPLATAEIVAPRAAERAGLVENLIRKAEGERAATQELGTQQVHAMQAAIDRAGGDRNLEAAATAAIGGDSAAFDAMVAANPKYAEVADNVARVRDFLASQQDLEAQLRNRGDAHLSPEGLRIPTVVSSRTQRGFGVLRDKTGEAATKAESYLDRIAGPSGTPGKQALIDTIKADRHVPVPSDTEINATAAGLRSVSVQRAFRDALNEISEKARNTPEQVSGLDADGASDAQKAARSKLSQLEEYLKGRGFDNSRDARHQIMDPASPLSKDRRLVEDLAANGPEWVKPYIRQAESQVVLDALGETKIPALRSIAAIKTFNTSIREAKIQASVAEALAEDGFYPPGAAIPAHMNGKLVKVEENWGPLSGGHIEQATYDVLKHEFSGGAQTKLAKAASILGKMARMGPVNSVLNAVDLAMNPVYQLKNAVGAQMMLFANHPTGFLGAASREALAATAQVTRRKLSTEAAPIIGRKIDARVALVDRELSHIPTVKTANEFETAFRKNVRDLELGSDLSREAGMLGIPTANRELGTLGRSLYKVAAAPRQAIRLGNEAITLADEVGRRQTFALELTRQAEIHGHPQTAAEIAEMQARAGAKTENVYQNGAMMPRPLQQLRQSTHLLGRAGYTLDVPRVMKGIVTEGLKEIADGVAGRVANPKASIKIGMQRLSGFLAVAGSMSAALAIKHGLSGEDTSKQEAAVARTGLGANSPGDPIFTSQDDQGREVSVNMASVAPFEPAVGVIRAIKRATESAPDDAMIETIAHDLGEQVGQMYLQLMPATQLAVELVRGKDRYDKPFKDDRMSYGDRRLAEAAHVGERLVPSALRGVQRDIKDAMAEDPKPRLSERAFMGLGRATDVAGQLDMAAKDLMSDATYRYFHNEDDRLKELRTEAQRIIADYKARGMTDNQIAQALMKRAGPKDAFLAVYLFDPHSTDLPSYVPRHRQ